MNPQDIVTYCKLHQISLNAYTAQVRFWVPGTKTDSGKTRLFDRRGPSVSIIEQRDRDDNPETPEILVEAHADEVIREVFLRLRKEGSGKIWTERVTAEVRAAAEIVANE